MEIDIKILFVKFRSGRLNQFEDLSIAKKNVRVLDSLAEDWPLNIVYNVGNSLLNIRLPKRFDCAIPKLWHQTSDIANYSSKEYC
jgi:hypothetical protein